MKLLNLILEETIRDDKGNMIDIKIGDKALVKSRRHVRDNVHPIIITKIIKKINMVEGEILKGDTAGFIHRGRIIKKLES